MAHYSKYYSYLLVVNTINIALFRTKTVESAKADGEKIRLIGGAEARAVEAVGRAEAERMRMKASAYKQYGDAAILSLVLEALPQVRIGQTL